MTDWTAAGRQVPNAVDRLTDLLDHIEDQAKDNERDARLDADNRLNLLFGHAIFAMLVGPFFALLYKSNMSSPSFSLMREVPGAPWTLAVWIFLAGLVLAVATLHRRHRAEFWALAALAAWYVIACVSFTGAIGIWTASAVETGDGDRLWDRLNWDSAPSLYAPIVYAHLAFTMAGHMATLWRKGLRGR